ncbi:hypothetical protein MEX01_49020 [Methylorubrum extorquens]|nr:hypothetical protein MEX01_49020 [Methylorubrum extorquens]
MVRSVPDIVSLRRQEMSQIDDAQIGPLRLVARTLLTHGRFWVLALAETFKRQPIPTVPPADATRHPIRRR